MPLIMGPLGFEILMKRWCLAGHNWLDFYLGEDLILLMFCKKQALLRESQCILRSWTVKKDIFW